MSDKTNILIYTEYREDIEELSDKQAGVLLKALLRYQDGESLPEMDKVVKTLFNPMRRCVDRNNERYTKRCERNKENARKRWEQKQNMQSDANACERMPENANASSRINSHGDNEPEPVPVREPVRDSDSDSTSYEVEEAEEALQPLPELTPEMDKRITDLFNSKAVTQKMDGIGLFGKRADDTRLALSHGVDKFFRTLESLDDQALFQQWSKEGRPLTYKWFIDPNHYQDIVEGNYRKKHSQTIGGGYVELKRDW